MSEERRTIDKLGDYESLDSGSICYDVSWSSAGHVVVAKEGKLNIININNKTVEKSILFADHPFSVEQYEDFIVVGVSLKSRRSEVIIYDKEYNMMRSWKSKGVPCDLAVADGKVLLSNQLSGNLEVYSMVGNSLPEIIWNGSSAGITSVPPDCIVLADERYDKVYKKQISGASGGDIIWSVAVKKPFSLFVDDKGCTWVRSNRNDCFTILSQQGEVIQELMDDKVTKLGEILGIMVQDDYLYVCHTDGMGRFLLHYT